MLTTPMAYNGMVTAPHHLAAQAGRDVLREGGNAIEAMVAAAAVAAVVYPHMNSIGGDGFWLIHHPDDSPIAIDACGSAAQAASIEFYVRQGLAQIPARGPLAANTVAGTVSGWQSALEVAAAWGGQLPLARLLEPAITYAREGVAVTSSQRHLTEQRLGELAEVSGFSTAFLMDREVPRAGARFVQARLAETLTALADRGLGDFYRGTLARSIAADLERVGSPLRLADLEAHQARRVEPLRMRLQDGEVFNLPPPTQGMASLMTLAIYEHCGLRDAGGAEYLHGLVEATKQAFGVRDREIQDPERMTTPAADFLRPHVIAELAAKIDLERACEWPAAGSAGDTIWMGTVDGWGRAVSFIQSIYWEFGSGVVLEESGIQWQNRGSSFNLVPGAVNSLAPNRRPFHTLNPALALLDDGRVMSYGTMGGEGQPQTQAAVYTRYVHQGLDVQAALTAPRWLLGKTWGDDTTSLKLEARFPAETVAELKTLGHVVEVVPNFDSMMGHAGALVRHADGRIEGGSDPRSEGLVASW